jgi:hypothetical protein
MKTFALWGLALLTTSACAQSEDGYIGYRLDKRGDPESAVYETDDTSSGVLPKVPDVHLNASVSVGSIDIEVDNITAKINLDTQVLKLLKLNAGVDASIDRVKLTIENVSAKVELEARLENVVAMVDDVLSSIDLNPIIATLGQDVSKIVNSTVTGVSSAIGGGGSGSSSSSTSTAAGSSSTGTTGSTKRSADNNYALDHNVLYSVNDYTGHTHTNRVLAQNGDIVDEYLDNDGVEHRRKVVGYYKTDMTFTGHNRTVTQAAAGADGSGEDVTEFELQYVYTPFPGVDVYSWIYVDAGGKVMRTQVIAEAFGGGMSTISNDSEL